MQPENPAFGAEGNNMKLFAQIRGLGHKFSVQLEFGL